jgi:aryl-alcohol dehydrogenase-like predicted oxidoreductase
MGVILGLGTIGIGRAWGYADAVVPDETSAMRALESAVRAGYTYFDTAPSYGLSEERLGAFLRSTGSEGLTIATKFGEHWDAEKQEPYTDHSFDALRRSLDQSVQRLGRVDVLQLHKTNPEALRSEDVKRAWEYAHSAGVREIGPSVSDLESAEIAAADHRYQVMQAPFNITNETFGDALRRGSERGMRIVANRPLGMGQLLYGEAPVPARDAFQFVLQQGFRGVILTGSKRPEHIEENMRAYRSLVLA